MRYRHVFSSNAALKLNKHAGLFSGLECSRVARTSKSATGTSTPKHGVYLSGVVKGAKGVLHLCADVFLWFSWMGETRCDVSTPINRLS